MTNDNSMILGPISWCPIDNRNRNTVERRGLNGIIESLDLIVPIHYQNTLQIKYYPKRAKVLDCSIQPRSTR